jgi:hypothetical protein
MDKYNQLQYFSVIHNCNFINELGNNVCFEDLEKLNVGFRLNISSQSLKKMSQIMLISY